MTRVGGSRFAPAALAVSALVSAELVAARALLHADSARVWLRGTPLAGSCAINDRFQVPCPGCGFSRGVVLALHGEHSASFALFPAAPLLVLGLVALPLVLVGAVVAERFGAERRGLARRLRVGGVAYVALLALVWGAGYAAHLSERSAHTGAASALEPLTPPR